MRRSGYFIHTRADFRGGWTVSKHPAIFCWQDVGASQAHGAPHFDEAARHGQCASQTLEDNNLADNKRGRNR